MVPNGSAYANYPSFANNGTKTPPGGSPESAKYALGMVPADTFPAEWANWLFHGATAGITRLNADVGSIKKEINSLLAAYNVTPDASVFNQLYTAIEKRISSLYPIGTIYQNASDSTNPGNSVMLGFGTWEQITDKFLAARGSTNIGASGGAWSVTLTANNIPRHKHVVDNHKHYMDHKHYTDIYHKHNYDDPGHSHGLSAFKNVSNNGVDSGVLPVYNTGEGASLRFPITSSGVGISIQYGPSDRDRLSTESRYIGNEGVNRQYTDYQSQTLYTDYQYAESPAAISITPTYVGVYTWKRTA
jgi:hypothetical protein